MISLKLYQKWNIEGYIYHPSLSTYKKEKNKKLAMIIEKDKNKKVIYIVQEKHTLERMLIDYNRLHFY